MPKRAPTLPTPSTTPAAEFDPNEPLDPARLLPPSDSSERQNEGPVTTSAAPELGKEANSPGSGTGAECAGNSQFPTHPGGDNQTPATDRMLLELPPLVDLSPEELAGYPDVNIEVRLIGPQGLKFRRLLRSMQAANVRLQGGEGYHVRSYADVIRQLVEQLPDPTIPVVTIQMPA